MLATALGADAAKVRSALEKLHADREADRVARHSAMFAAVAKSSSA